MSRGRPSTATSSARATRRRGRRLWALLALRPARRSRSRCHAWVGRRPAEVRYGIERLADGRRKDLLRSAAEDVFSAFADHILAFDATAAVDYAAIVSARDRTGAPIDGFDAQIAAICRAHGATLATRNIKTSTTPASKSPIRGTTAHEGQGRPTSVWRARSRSEDTSIARDRNRRIRIARGCLRCPSARWGDRRDAVLLRHTRLGGRFEALPR